ncbi:hypothetical protein LJR219_001638 [Phenylobacterium sp. LjRoot219]|uniref:bestrophin-like domain n=1 Tax=Phenylobacterium sp. LjRoot219 TaxID=3342283 RepID=UPI003ED07A8F
MPTPSHLWVFPLWFICLAFSTLLLVTHELGVRWRRYVNRKEGAIEELGGNYLGSSLGLLALLVGFSFGMAVDRYNTRRNLVSEEANAISTTFRRVQALDEPDRSRLTLSLLPYAEAREAFSLAKTAKDLRETEARTDEREAEFWATVSSVTSKDPPARAVLDAANAMFNTAATRRAAVEAVIPRVILGALLLYALIASVLMGYSHPPSRRSLPVSVIQFVLLSLAFGMIIDLDRPRTGFATVDQHPVTRAVAVIRNTAETAAAPAPVRLPP